MLCHSCMPGDGHSWKSLWLGRTWAGWGRDGAGSVPSAQGCVSPSLMGTPGRECSTVPIPSHPTPPSPRHKPGLLEDSHHWGWLTPGDNIRSQWGTAGLIGRILPLCSAAAVPGPSMQPPPPLHALKAQQPFLCQCTSLREWSGVLPHQGGGEKGVCLCHLLFAPPAPSRPPLGLG